MSQVNPPNAGQAAEPTPAERHYAERYDSSWEEASLNPAQLLETQLRQWFEAVFDGVKPSFFGPMGRVSIPCMARLNYAKRKMTWFTLPQSWNQAQRAVLRHGLGHDPDQLATHTFREGEYWLNFHLNFSAQPRLKRFPQCAIAPGSALLGSDGASKTVTLCAPADAASEPGYVVKTSSFEDGLLQESLALRQLPPALSSPRDLGISLGELNKGRRANISDRTTLFRHQNLQTLQVGYNLTVIPGVAHVLPMAQQALALLVDPGAPETSLAQQAERLRAAIAASGVHDSLKRALLQLLERVEDTTPLRPSRQHGDFRRANLLAVPDGLDFEASSFSFRLSVIDWELSQPLRLGVLDYVQLLLDLHRVSLNSTSLGELFGEGQRDQFCTNLRECQLPGSEADPSELLALHLATFAFERAWGFGGLDRGAGYAERLRGPWPFD